MSNVTEIPDTNFSVADMEWYSWVYVGFTGGGVGFVGGFAGIGGLPLMVAMLRSPPLDICQHMAQGTVLAVMLPPMALLGVWVMREEVKLLWKHAAAACECYCPACPLPAAPALLVLIRSAMPPPQSSPTRARATLARC